MDKREPATEERERGGRCVALLTEKSCRTLKERENQIKAKKRSEKNAVPPPRLLDGPGKKKAVTLMRRKL
jgi:hypothetical protein